MADNQSSQSDHDDDTVTSVRRTNSVIKPDPIKLIVKDPDTDKRKYNVSRVASPRSTR